MNAGKIPWIGKYDNCSCFSCAQRSQEYLHCHRHSERPLKVARTGNESGHRATKSTQRPVERRAIVPAVTSWQCLKLHTALVVTFPVPNEPFSSQGLHFFSPLGNPTSPPICQLSNVFNRKWTRLKCFLTLPPTLDCYSHRVNYQLIGVFLNVLQKFSEQNSVTLAPHCCCDCGEEVKVVRKICLFSFYNRIIHLVVGSKSENTSWGIFCSK
jgi:hypothetical protein